MTLDFKLDVSWMVFENSPNTVLPFAVLVPKQRVSVGDGQFPGQFPWSILRFSLKTAEEFCQQRAHTEEGT